ncbi:carbohydrate ABC transporter permease [Clostridium sp. 19966]|uniref:carbohydrate ABC transporter permease n=1 Tax=Clostridium sp. 19966 TaxID=2768166 RepID=UPI0028DD8E3D|nr:carbohydrate ABC transporter permease [Clostridium sp. 19966]MDT8719143.1 carbohydrate ABC transporter permease [Clostridium sp. 19966]
MSSAVIVSRSKKKRKMIIKNTIVYIFLVIGAIFMAIPFLWMLSTSLKTEGTVFSIPPQWIPDKLMWSNYSLAVSQGELVQGLVNTLTIVIPTTIIGLFSCCLAAYGFAKMEFPGRDKLFMLLLSTMMIPGIVTMIPSFVIFKQLDWLDTFKPLMIPGMFGGAACIFFLRQYFMTLPKELTEAAELDGLSYFGIFLRIALPLSKPAIATQAIFGFLGGYNDYMGPLIYLNSPDKFTLQLKLATFNGAYSSSWTLIMAGSVLALIPTVALFFFAQKYFIEGIVMTGMKG